MEGSIGPKKYRPGVDLTKIPEKITSKSYVALSNKNLPSKLTSHENLKKLLLEKVLGKKVKEVVKGKERKKKLKSRKSNNCPKKNTD